MISALDPLQSLLHDKRDRHLVLSLHLLVHRPPQLTAWGHCVLLGDVDHWVLLEDVDHCVLLGFVDLSVLLGDVDHCVLLRSEMLVHVLAS